MSTCKQMIKANLLDHGSNRQSKTGTDRCTQYNLY